MKYGYARVSTKEQNLEMQLDALKKEKCDKIFTEKISTRKTLKEFSVMVERFVPGDVLIVYSITRMNRTLKELIQIWEMLKQKEIEFISLQDNIDTGKPHGKLMFHLISVFAEMERDQISERTKDGLKAARARGRIGGRPTGLSEEAKMKAIYVKKLFTEKHTIQSIIKKTNLSRGTVYKYIKQPEVGLL